MTDNLRAEIKALNLVCIDAVKVWSADQSERLADVLAPALHAAGFRRIDPTDEALVERCARALCLADYRDPDEIGPVGANDYGEAWRKYVGRARAVLAEVAK